MVVGPQLRLKRTDLNITRRHSQQASANRLPNFNWRCACFVLPTLANTEWHREPLDSGRRLLPFQGRCVLTSFFMKQEEEYKVA